jgi:aspartate/methionine/tyrosine aminotransferase
MNQVSTIVSGIDPPESIEVAEAAKERAAQGHDVINLGWGEPHFDTPTPVKEKLHDAVDAGETNYTTGAGILPLRERIAEKLRTDNGVDADPDELLVTPGAKQAIFIAIRALVDPGDEVVVLDPGWTSYTKMVELAGATPVSVVGDPGNRFVPAPEDLAAAVTDYTAAIIVNPPGNPTGTVLTRDELESIADVARRHDACVIADEIYEHYTYDDAEHVSMATLDGMADRTITVNGLSKSHAMTGWRLGYLHAPPQIADATKLVNQHLNTCATSFVQHAAIEAFDATDHLPDAVATYRRNRDVLVDGVPFETVTPEGAFYCLIDVREHTDDAGRFAKHLLEETNVALTPGRTYGEGGEGFLRAAFALEPRRIAAAAERDADFVRD